MKMPREDTRQVNEIPRSRQASTLDLTPLFLNKVMNIVRNEMSPTRPHVQSTYQSAYISLEGIAEL